MYPAWERRNEGPTTTQLPEPSLPGSTSAHFPTLQSGNIPLNSTPYEQLAQPSSLGSRVLSRRNPSEFNSPYDMTARACPGRTVHRRSNPSISPEVSSLNNELFNPTIFLTQSHHSHESLLRKKRTRLRGRPRLVNHLIARLQNHGRSEPRITKPRKETQQSEVGIRRGASGIRLAGVGDPQRIKRRTSVQVELRKLFGR